MSTQEKTPVQRPAVFLATGSGKTQALQLLDGLRDTFGGEMTFVVAPPEQHDATTTTAFNPLEIAITDVKSYLQGARKAGLRVESGLGVLQHVVTDEQIILSRDQIDDVLEQSATRRRELRQEYANIEAFERRFRALAVGSDYDVARHPAADGEHRRQAYWGRVRSELQTWFNVSLEDLANLLGIAKATLIYIDRSGRSPRPSTTRKLMDVHAIASALIANRGNEVGRTWLSRDGLAALRDGGVAALDRAVSAAIYARRRSADPFALDTDFDPDTAPARRTEMEARAF